MKSGYLTLLLFFCVISNFCQVPELYKEIYNTYPKYKAEGLETRRFKHSEIKERIENLAGDSAFTVQQVGTSIEGRELYLVSIGKGKTNIFLWSQMHGDEPTATMALFDVFEFFKSEGFEKEKQELLTAFSVHFLPMVNPDGAEKFQRRNSLNIDLNRDALRLQSPESKILKRIRDSLQPQFGYNLHDQSKYYNVGLTEKPATISFLAPPYDQEKSINKVRGNAMKLIVEMNNLLQEYIPGQVGRYRDDFESRAFGDNFQKWGTSTILIESGGLQNDPEKQEIRRLNYTIILASLFAISNKEYEKNDLKMYDTIPENDRKLLDLKISSMTYKLKGKEYLLGLGINRREVEDIECNTFYYSSEIVERGDLRTNFGYEEFDASGYKYVSPKISPVTYSMRELDTLNYYELLKEGYAYLKISDLPEEMEYTDYPVNLVPVDFELPKGITSNFFLSEEGELKFAVINGFLQNLREEDIQIKNALILQ